MTPSAEAKLFLAGTADHDTTFTEAQELFTNAAPPKELVFFEGAGHEDLLDFAPEKYKQTVLKFLATNLK